MTIIKLYFKLTIIWYLQETFCTNLEESPVIQESIEHIAAHQNPPIDITKKDSSKVNVKSDCSFGANSSSECDSCHSTSSIDDDDDSELVEDCSFSKSTIDYLILILDELKLKTTEITMFFSRSKFLNFIDDSINLIDLFGGI